MWKILPQPIDRTIDGIICTSQNLYNKQNKKSAYIAYILPGPLSLEQLFHITSKVVCTFHYKYHGIGLLDHHLICLLDGSTYSCSWETKNELGKFIVQNNGEQTNFDICDHCTHLNNRVIFKCEPHDPATCCPSLGESNENNNKI